MSAVGDDPTNSLALAAPRSRPWRLDTLALIAGLGWIAVGVFTIRWPEEGDFARTPEFAIAAIGFGLLLALLSVGASWSSALAARLKGASRWLLVLAVWFGVWEAVTAKLALLPMPFFPPPQAILEVFLDDWRRLGESLWRSFLLLGGGYLVGAVVGFITGVAIGWSRAVGYWVHPLLRFVGPLPATAWLPLAFFLFPSSWSASTFLIALATGFPVTVLTWSGIAGVSKAYYDVARTLGASERFLILKVAIPAAMPHVFVGLFMGLGGSFAVLVVAEMLGVKAGLGWYLQWAQGWASYANMYAALAVMALACSGLITLLFKLRDRLLSWQRGLVQW